MSRLLISSLRFHTIHIFIDAHVSRSYLVTHLLQLCLESLQSKELIKALKKWPSQKRQTLPSAFSVATLVKRESTLLEINISHPKALLKMIFLFPRWDMLVYWRVPHSFSPLFVSAQQFHHGTTRFGSAKPFCAHHLTAAAFNKRSRGKTMINVTKYGYCKCISHICVYIWGLC